MKTKAVKKAAERVFLKNKNITAEITQSNAPLPARET
jgi:hypothetical protein